jgi:hypothetical protein
MFTWNYPQPGDTAGLAFVSTQQFLIWVFLFAVLFSILTIFIVPLWGMLIILMNHPIYVEDEARKRRRLVMLFVEGIILTLALIALMQFINWAASNHNLDRFMPKGHLERMYLTYLYTFVTVLPALLGMFLIHRATGELSTRIEMAERNEAKLFALIAELRFFRTVLQNYLAIVGIILSLIPIATAGLRAILIALNPENEKIFPITSVIVYGLVFTIILLLIYVPTHFALTEVSRKLRDQLRPLAGLDTLTDDMNQRKALDELLQTNIGLTQNLKMGLITLAPLATSLITSLLNINLSL